ncbi:hypothetical protein SARC_00292 [Sphaeroforma arctica JP610]|uniref:Uncharacterized protein n=1 Tax=Sphaeroforma arctica JP610 TaxID=667725 RepID=A0A0L0GFI4_9EUKA|nr:hypothetical protein SARC_00292 [Sphaeroforma arctica JP610]KNC87591.1 hypothetical protein SARC_00292 [Sphaeroforma arctica JP610]|eukprot:XP_014161493.1 hypothetical protein SARC_00292 [Sphaeroforma arctica JP610]
MTATALCLDNIWQVLIFICARFKLLVARSNKQTVKKSTHLNEIININWNDDSTNNETCLFAAVRNALPGVVDTVISLGADVNHKNSVGETALHIATQGGKAEIIERLVSAGASVEPGDTYEGKSPPHLAASSGHVGAVFAILGHGANPSKPERMHGRTPLHEVVRKRKKLVPEKVTRGMPSRTSSTSQLETTSENFGSNSSINSIASSISGCHDDDVWAQCARALKQHGADLYAKDIEGKTPLHYAKEGFGEAKKAGRKKFWHDLLTILCPANETEVGNKKESNFTINEKDSAYLSTSVATAK